MTIITHKTDPDFSIKVATPAEWHIVAEMARNEHWNLGQGDIPIFLNVDNNGFFAGLNNDDVVASISVVNFTPNYAHLGHYIVRPEYQGQGKGLALWTAAIEHAGERCIGLDAMPEQEKNYSKWGFQTHYLTYRVQGHFSDKAIKADNIQQITNRHLPAIVEFDSQFTGYFRPDLLSLWFTDKNRQGFILTEGQTIQALIALRPADEGYRIGPFYAAERSHAIALIQAALAAVPTNVQVTLDIPEQASEILEYLAAAGFKILFHTCRMYRGTPPAGYRNGLNAITSLELG